MKKNRLSRTLKLLLCCAALFAALSVSGLLDKQKIWPDVPIEYLQGKESLSLEAGDAYTTVTGGPYTELPAGQYRLKWQIEGDGVNVVQLKNSNDVEIVPARFETVPGAFEGEAYFELRNAVHNFSISVEFCDGTWITVHNMRLYSPVYRDHYFTLAALMLLAVILSWMHEHGRLPASRREILIPLIIAVCFASVPALQEDVIAAHDINFHAIRLHNLLDGLRSGQFPARVGGYSYNGYGAVTSVFYPDLMLYPFALMLHLGASMAYVLNALILTMNALAALCMYIAAKRMFRDERAGVFAAIVYVCCGFRLDRLYVSYMVGQMLAMAFVPVFILGLWEVFFGDKSRWMTLTVGATLIFQCHMLTTLMCAGVAAAAVLCFGYRLWRERGMGALAKAIAWTVLLNLTTLVPLATTYLSGVTTSVGTYGFVDLTHEMVQMFGTDKELGLAMILGVAALFCVKGGMLSKETWRDVVILMALGVVCVFMCTDMFPWSYVFALTNNAFEILQFSWRFLAIGAPCLALCAGLGYACLLRGGGAKGILAVLAVAVLSATPIINMALDMDVMEFGTDGTPYVLTPEYQFEDTDLESTRSRAVLTEGDVQLTDYEKDGTKIRAHVDAGTDSAVALPLFGFEGYAAEINGEQVEWTRGINNRLTVKIPSGTRGELRIWFEGNTIWRVADAVSLMSFAAFCAYGLNRRRAARRNGGVCL